MPGRSLICAQHRNRRACRRTRENIAARFAMTCKGRSLSSSLARVGSPRAPLDLSSAVPC